MYIVEAYFILGSALLFQAINPVPHSLEKSFPFLDLQLGRHHLRVYWLLAGLYALSLVLSPTLSFILLSIVCFQVLKHFFSSVPLRRRDRMIVFYLYLLVPIQLLFATLPLFKSTGLIIGFVLSLLPFALTRGWGRFKSASIMAWGMMGAVIIIGHLTTAVIRPQLVQPLWAGLGFVTYVSLFHFFSRRWWRGL